MPVVVNQSALISNLNHINWLGKEAELVLERCKALLTSKTTCYMQSVFVATVLSQHQPLDHPNQPSQLHHPSQPIAVHGDLDRFVNNELAPQLAIIDPRAIAPGDLYVCRPASYHEDVARFDAGYIGFVAKPFTPFHAHLIPSALLVRHLDSSASYNRNARLLCDYYDDYYFYRLHYT